MKMDFKKEIEKLIEINSKTYRDNNYRFIADYNRELELIKEYNGRQLLELLQNADDAGSKEVEIKLDKEKKQLTISNKGEAFTVEGINSLMIADLSPKTEIIYIGNKGLGFRSILNWAEHINIYSRGFKISFSEAIAKEVFNEDLNLSEDIKKKLRKERDLTDLAVPFPILAIPRIVESTGNKEWVTSIEINYKEEFEEDQSLRTEILKINS